MSIADKLTTLNSIKQNIKNAIIAKGVQVLDTDSFTIYANKISQISQGSTINNQNKNINITQEGTTQVTYDSGYTGLGTVNINTQIKNTYTLSEVKQAGGLSIDVESIQLGTAYYDILVIKSTTL